MDNEEWKISDCQQLNENMDLKKVQDSWLGGDDSTCTCVCS